MEKEEREIAERLEAATTLLERTLSWLEERQGALAWVNIEQPKSGQLRRCLLFAPHSSGLFGRAVALLLT